LRFPHVVVAFGATVGLLTGTALTAEAAVTPLTAVQTAAPADASVALAPGVTAFYEMNEPAGTTVMHDSGPSGLNAPVDPTGITSGAVYDGATGYNWVHRPPEQAPPSPERVIQVPDDIDLEPGNGPFTIELRYRSKESFGNITQKGQAQSVGGQWKIQSPQGIPSCLFAGSGGQVATGAKTPLNDNEWHNLTCVLTSTGVSMYVDGVFRNRKNGSTGTIDNGIPMTIGGKINCDQVEITCDYFSGQIDFVKITKAANLGPTASFTGSCYGLTCAFDSSASADADGSLTKYTWDFGDGQTSTAVNPSHTYATPGSYNVRLTVTDNQASTDSDTRPLIVEEAPPIESPVEFVDSMVATGNNNRPTVTVPAAAAPGDRLVMVLGYNNLSRTVQDPTGVTGWTRLDSVSAGTMGSVAWTKVVQPGDPGTSVVAPLSGSAKYTITLSAYTGVEETPGVAFARAADLSTTDTHVTPVVSAPAGSWVVSYWADKSGTTTTWTPDGSVATRETACGADGGRICSALADSGAPLPASSYGNIPATTNAASDMATMWSFVLAPSTGEPPVNQPPTAAFSSSCTLLDCDFDSSESEDTDGTITSYLWDFGDGATSAEASPAHTYAAAGTYDVTLTVTDDDGDPGTVTHSVEVDDEVYESPVDYVGSAVTAGSSATPSVVVPAGAAVGDRLLLALSLNNTTRTFTGPSGVTGWTQLDNVVADDMRTVFWTKVAQAGDPGATVAVPLSGSAKYTATVAAYTGVVTSTPVFARAVDTANHTARVTPAVTAPEGAWVVSYWADKSSTTTAWTPQASVTSRQGACSADSGRICSAFADSGDVVPAGPNGGITATTNAPSSKATTWSIVLAPAP
jgi:PKD repeat protein